MWRVRASLPYCEKRSRQGLQRNLELSPMEDDRRIQEGLAWRKVSSRLVEETLNFISLTRGQGGTSRWKTS